MPHHNHRRHHVSMAKAPIIFKIINIARNKISDLWNAIGNFHIDIYVYIVFGMSILNPAKTKN